MSHQHLNFSLSSSSSFHHFFIFIENSYNTNKQKKSRLKSTFNQQKRQRFPLSLLSHYTKSPRSNPNPKLTITVVVFQSNLKFTLFISQSNPNYLLLLLSLSPDFVFLRFIISGPVTSQFSGEIHKKKTSLTVMEQEN